MLALAAWEEKGGLLQQPLHTQWLTGMGMPSPGPSSHPQLPSMAGSLTRLVPRGWDPHQSWPAGEGCTGPPRRPFLPLLSFPQTRRQFSSLPHGHPCRDGSGTCHPQGPQGTSKAEPRDPAKVDGEEAKSRVLTQWQACSNQISLETWEVSVVCHS